MFDLENAINDWMSSLLTIDSMSAESRLEIEEHLRQSIDTLSKGGLTQEESFVIATRRMGAPNALADEFEKVQGTNGLQKRLTWMLFGYLAIQTMSTLIGSTLSASGVALIWIGSSGAIAAVGSCLLAILIWLGFLWSIQRQSSPFSRWFVPEQGSISTLLFLAGITLIGYGVSLASTVVFARRGTIDQLADFSLWTGLGRWLISGIVFVFIAAILVRANQSPKQVATT